MFPTVFTANRRSSTAPGGGPTNVADADARRSIDPTGKIAGFQVTQADDPGFVYTFIGAGDDVDAGLWVTLAGTADYRGPYAFNGTTTYNQIGGASHTVVADGPGGVWGFHSNPDYYGDQVKSFAWDTPGWLVGPGGINPAPAVDRNPMTSDNNWLRTSYP